jgi:hypothetical protein
MHLHFNILLNLSLNFEIIKNDKLPEFFNTLRYESAKSVYLFSSA